MTAAGKTTAARVQAGDRILVKHYTMENEADRPTLEWLGKERALGISTRKTGEGVTVARVLRVEARMITGGRRDKRVYDIYTTEGVLENNAPAQTMMLAPEDAAGIKRAHAEALELDKVYEAYPVAEEAPAVPAKELDIRPVELEIPLEGAGGSMAHIPADVALGVGPECGPGWAADVEPEVREELVKIMPRANGKNRAAEVAALREEFTGAARWDAGRRIAIRLRLAQLSATVYEDRHETPEEYEVDRLRARFHSTNIPAERERIQAKLAALGTVVHPEGSPEYERYRRDLKAALAEWVAGN
jgi:hypothetical protein